MIPIVICHTLNAVYAEYGGGNHELPMQGAVLVDLVANWDGGDDTIFFIKV